MTKVFNWMHIATILIVSFFLVVPAGAIVWIPDGDRYTATLGGDTLLMWNITGVTMNWTPPTGVTLARYLAIAAGGQGGSDRGGGGGAGGVWTNTTNVTPGVPITVIIGKRGYQLSTIAAGADGGSTVFGDANPHGGGGGGNYSHAGRNGGSGGGGAFDSNSGGTAVTSPFREGYDGGAGSNTPSDAGGGGGANSTGSSGAAGRFGGQGIVSNITGENITYAEGGIGGGFFDTSGVANATCIGCGGPGGGYSGVPQLGKSGTDGIVIVRYATPATITANFTISNTSGQAPLFTHFTDTSTTSNAIIDSWNWSFGDGNISSLQSPDFTYVKNGTYSANLTITNVSYSLISTKINTIIVYNPAPVANFAISNQSGQPPMIVRFTDTSTGENITHWNWSFGDGNISASQNPLNIFYALGEYQVNLTVTNDGGSSIKLQNVSVIDLNANFTASNETGLLPLYVQFTDTSSGVKIDTWNWSFGDYGVGNTSSLQNPDYTYTVAGKYSVNLTVTNGTVSVSKLKNISVYNSLPVANFTASNETGMVPLYVQFTDTSTGVNITQWYWDFGDGNTSSLQNPDYTYNYIGTYKVNLTVTNDGGSSNVSNNITVYDFDSSYTASPLSGPSPLTVVFSETTTGLIPDTYYWEFGDGGTDNVQNPTHIYNTIGVFDISHRITNGTISVWNNKTSYIRVNISPSADFSGIPTTGYLNPTTMVVSFTDNSIGEGINQWSWNFGDGSPNSTLQNPTHSYGSVGTFDVFLKIWAADGNASITKIGYITVFPMVADFTTSHPPYEGLPVQFIDTSLGNPTVWSWDFDDGGMSALQNPFHTFAASGTYSVKLTIENGVESVNVTKPVVVTGPPPPYPDFNIYYVNITDGSLWPLTTMSVKKGEILAFNSTSTNASAFAWAFGDGFTDNEKNSTHRYTFGKNGYSLMLTDGWTTADVKLTVSNSLFSASTTKTINITTAMSDLVFVTDTIAPLNESYANGFIAAIGGNDSVPAGWIGIDWLGGVGWVQSVYVSVLGATLFFLILFSIPFIMQWIISKDFVVAGIMGGLIGVWMISRLPASMRLLAVTFIAMSIVAIIYSLLKERM